MAAAGYQIATILPPGEHFSPAAAGAIALFVRDTTLNSAYHENITVYGRKDTIQRRFANIRYQAIQPPLTIFGAERAYISGLVDRLRKDKPHLIEVHNNVAIFNAIAKYLPDTPISIYFHNDPVRRKPTETPKQRWQILSRADAIYCCSEYVRRRFMTGLEAGRTNHVHVVPEYSAIKARKRKEPFIVYVGRLSKEKGALELARAAQTLLPHFPNWRIVFAGADRPGGKNDTAYARNVYKTLQSLGKQAVFLGHQPHNRVIELYRRASIAVVPSIYSESKGRAAIEAITAGCALVTSGHGSLAEIAGQSGLLVSPVTSQGLALSLQGLLEDPHTLEAIQNICFQQGQYYSLETGRQHFDSLRYMVLNQAYN
jgi:glycosyltransferase involved in cell wall biosynthesis